MDAQSKGVPPQGQEEVPENKTPETIMFAYESFTAFLGEYGWFLLFAGAFLVFLYTKLQPYLIQMRERREEEDYYKKYDSGTVLKRQQAMEAARQRLQQQHDEQAAAFAEKQKERDEKKRQERLEDWDRHQQGLGYRSKVKKEEEPTPGPSQPKPKKKRLRDDDFNPMMGSGGACYRPPRRGGAGGG